jgi:hypothetical protein
MKGFNFVQFESGGLYDKHAAEAWNLENASASNLREQENVCRGVGTLN